MHSPDKTIPTIRQSFGLAPSITRTMAALGLSAAIAACHGAPPALASSSACASITRTPAPTTPALNAQTFDSAWTIIARSHWDPAYNGVNWKAVRDSLRPKAIAAPNVEALRSVLTAMVGTLGQSHFAIIPAEQNDRAQVGRDLNGDIGATIRDVDGAIVVTAARNDGPAYRAGIRAGVVIEGVDGCAIAKRRHQSDGKVDERRGKMEHWAAVMGRLRGPVGATVRISARDASGSRVAYAVIREPIAGTVTTIGNLPPMSARLESEQRLVDGRKIGIIRFNIWMPILSEGIRKAVDSLRGSDAIVLDLRGNVGGIGMMATGVAGYFVDTALTLGTLIQQGGTQRYVINPQRVNSQNQRVKPFAGPLAIVVDELSISTTEIFAGGLQALDRARVFGSQTPGEALPAVAEELPNGDVLYHAIANFLSAAGKPLEGTGVIPDVAVPVTRSQLVKGRDPALDAALRWAASAGSVQNRKP